MEGTFGCRKYWQKRLVDRAVTFIDLPVGAEPWNCDAEWLRAEGSNQSIGILAVDWTQAEQLIDWMNPEQKPDQVVKIVKRAAFPFSDYHEDYTVRYCVRIDREVAKLNGGCGTQSFPNFLSHRYISSTCLLSGHSALHLQYLCASTPLWPSLRCFFFFFFPFVREGLGVDGIISSGAA